MQVKGPAGGHTLKRSGRRESCIPLVLVGMIGANGQ